MIKRIAISVILTLALVACTSPINTVIPTNRNDWDTKLAPAVQKLSEEDEKLFTAYMLRHLLDPITAGILKEDSDLFLITPGTTIGQAIAEQKIWVAQQVMKNTVLKKEQEAKNEALRKQMDQMITVTLLSKSFKPKDIYAVRILDQQYFSVSFKNISDKSIAGISGDLVITDLFGKDVLALTIDVIETIEPGKSYIWKGGYHYNEFDANQRAVRDLSEDKYKTRFEPKIIVFTDGTSIKVED
jgi:hypothetical protein